MDFSIYLILPAAIWPRGFLSLQQKLVSRIFLGDKERPTPKVDNLTAISKPIFFKNVRASIFQSPIGLHGLLQ
jgi:hypothetical protein